MTCTIISIQTTECLLFSPMTFEGKKSSTINIFPSLDIGIERISLSFGYMVIYHNQYIKRTIFNWVSS